MEEERVEKAYMMREVQLGMRDTINLRRKKNKILMTKNQVFDHRVNVPPANLFMRQELQFLGHYLNKSNAKLLKQEESNPLSAA